MIKELFIKISLFILMLATIIIPICLAIFINTWFLFGVLSFIPVYCIAFDYCEDHTKSSFLNVDEYL